MSLQHSVVVANDTLGVISVGLSSVFWNSARQHELHLIISVFDSHRMPTEPLIFRRHAVCQIALTFDSDIVIIDQHRFRVSGGRQPSAAADTFHQVTVTTNHISIRQISWFRPDRGGTAIYGNRHSALVPTLA